MKPTKDQIEALYGFTRRHFVEHYDLQTELVDHLAQGIEEQWAENPHMSFDQALKAEFRKFGVFGFHDVIKEKTRAMEKKYWKILWSLYKSYLRPPKILMFILMTIAVYTVISILPYENRGYFIALFFVGVMSVIFIKSIKNRKRLKEKSKKWMLEDMILNHGTSIAFVNLGLQFCINPWILNKALYSPLGSLVMTFLLTAMALLFYVMVFEIPPRTEEFLMKTYPEYKME